MDKFCKNLTFALITVVVYCTVKRMCDIYDDDIDDIIIYR